mmetsp:Transcript_17345/g.29912  ORF Transcript_17345/g.29912 Transcript_17345/m.29912 type:complete len:372 (+) Transcript_17345:335-1450(+)|eukprot:CAMPEP_0183736300 /NCGR_PEP_ID=MMETSP0737-20130205/48995_1 /TAXON_ID=385413 /ORGANISM="Thalassiosira miniscula, Strain CCMP1093" /LENGTH=371 /DNA_ID=CAMNT_0025970261 /DNA_START=261 /DNA_END=1376 /DNA_ORIENTATION=+
MMKGVAIGFVFGATFAHLFERYLHPSLTTVATTVKENCNCTSLAAVTSTTLRASYSSSKSDIANGLILPFEKTAIQDYLPGKQTDSYTYFHNYLNKFAQASPSSPKDFSNLPLLHIWPRYFEAYHNHWQRYRGKGNVVFMEIGVQSGGKIPMLRDYFGPGLTYIGLDINPSCKMFESAPWIHIEIGDSGDRQFLESIKQKYPKVDIFLDDGGHKMDQQRLAMEMLLPHITPDGVFMCEDLSTSWGKQFGGMPGGTMANVQFRNKTTMGLVLQTVEWLNAGWIPGGVMNFQMDHPIIQTYWQDTPWWKEFVRKVKHVHLYNQLVVYELGHYDKPYATKTVGYEIPYADSGQREKVVWEPILERIKSLTNSPW